MQYRAFGNLGYDVSLLGFGCMRFPRIYHDDGTASVDLEKSFALIRYAYQHGINYFDTAYSYHHMQSESILGEAVEGFRDKIKIATKQPLTVMNSRGDIRRNLENTLKKLRSDYVDIYLVHNINADSWGKCKDLEVFREYEALRDEGLIKAIGFSYHGGYPLFEEILTTYDWQMCQVQQNLMDVDKEVTAKSIQAAGEKGAALVIMEPLRGGGLANAPAPVKQLYDSWPEKRSAAEWAFRHVIQYPQVGTVLSGMTTMEQLQENIEIFSKPDALPGCLTPEERELLDKARAAYESLTAVPCTGCEYCLPCPAGVDIPGVFSKYNACNMFEDADQPRRSYMFQAMQKKSAELCVECGACESACPQNIAIIEALKQSHKVLQGWIE